MVTPQAAHPEEALGTAPPYGGRRVTEAFIWVSPWKAYASLQGAIEALVQLMGRYG